jgi:hypothetical protein
MASPHFITLGDNQWDTFLGPSPSYANVGIEFYGTDPAHPPGVEFGTLATQPANSHAVWTFNEINGYGSGIAEAYGSANLFPYSGMVDLLHGVTQYYANISLNITRGGEYVLNGASTVTDNSILTANGGPYHANSFILNGSLNVSNNSIANFDNATLLRRGAPSMRKPSPPGFMSTWEMAAYCLSFSRTPPA